VSVVVGIWALGSLALPWGFIGGAAAALFGLAFGGIALIAHASGGWRKTALVGLAISGLALLVAVGEVVYILLVG
jgi:hypothetical protein